MKSLRKCGNYLHRRFPAKIAAAVIVCLLPLAFLGAVYFKTKVLQILDQERADFTKHAEIPFKKIPRHPHQNNFVKIWQSAQNVRSLAEFNDSIFAATDGGLAEYDATGKLLRHFTVLDGLPESDLICLAVFQSKLFIGARTKGLISFDGEIFESFQFENHSTQSITALLNDSQTLLVGTFAGGLLEFDGRRFVEIKNEAEKMRFEKINCLYKINKQLFIGTFDDGLWFYENGLWRQFTNADGLLSNRIVGIESFDKQIFIAADLGISKTDFSRLSQSKPFQNNLILPTLSGITEKDETILLSKENGEIFTIQTNTSELKFENLKNHLWKKPENFANAKILKTGEDIWLIGNQGIRLFEKQNFKLFSGNSNKNPLSNNMISALALDADERLWIGSFRGGIDVLTEEGKKLKHIEDKNIREINFLLSDAETKAVRAATSHGVFSFDKNYNFSALTKSEGLLSDSVTHIRQTVSAEPKQSAKSTIFYATSRGLMFGDEKNLNAITGVNGLPGNSVYATLSAGNFLFAGTLNGLAQIENGKVIRVYKDSNSNLKQNWVTALYAVNERVFIGTYGGGIFELSPSGEIHSFAAEAGKFVVNPNAIFSDSERLFVGTLEGVWVLDLISNKWTNLRDFLPSETVLSITGNAENIFFGTTGGIARINRNYWQNRNL